MIVFGFYVIKSGLYMSDHTIMYMMMSYNKSGAVTFANRYPIGTNVHGDHLVFAILRLYNL